jgi:hypothetical protein
MPQPLAKDIAIQEIVAGFAAMPGIRAIALGGSANGPDGDLYSDIDLYVYAATIPPVSRRDALIRPRAASCEINNQFWETGDEWIEKTSGVAFDVMYRSPQWIEGELDAVVKRFRPSLGYSTCLWYNIMHSQILFDSVGWFADLQKQFDVPYPEKLKKAIAAYNLPVLFGNQSSFYVQIEKALKREDWVSVNHRLTAFLASYFDVLLALNELPHPGEKRLLAYCEKHCKILPANAFTMIEQILTNPFDKEQLLVNLKKLVENVRVLR